MVEIDGTFYIQKILSWTGLVWNLKSPPDVVRRNTHRLGIRVIQRAAAQLANSFDPELIAVTITASVTGPRHFAFQEKLAEAQHRAADLLATYQYSRRSAPNVCVIASAGVVLCRRRLCRRKKQYSWLNESSPM
jgi:stearoyl-CoA desaturase (delta-9 desaturase)